MAAVATQEEYLGTGRRKRSVARVRLRQGSGKVKVNGKDIQEFFPIERHRKDVLSPLVLTDNLGKFDVVVTMHGGGISGQAGALRLGISRALLKFDEETRNGLKKAGFLTRDAREVERKKYGLAGARKRYQYSKR